MDPSEQLKAADMNIHTATPDTTTADIFSPELVIMTPLFEGRPAVALSPTTLLLLKGPSPESPSPPNTFKLAMSQQEWPFKVSAAKAEREFMLGQPMLPQDEVNVLPPACRKLHAAYMNLAKLKKDSIQVAIKKGDSFHDLLDERKFDIYFDDLFHFFNSKPIESAFLRSWTLHMSKKQENAHMGFLDAFMVSARNIDMNKETNLVRQYVIKVLQDQKDKDHVMFAYTQGDHWITVVIALRHNKVYYLDSVEGRRTFTPITEVLDGVFADFAKKGVDDVFAKFAKTGEGSKLQHIFDCPCHKQPDGKSCGFYTMHHMELVADFVKTDDDLKNFICPIETLHPDVINGKRELVAIFINDEVINPGGEFFHVAVMSSSLDTSTLLASMVPTPSSLALEAREHAKSPKAGYGGEQQSQRPQLDYRLLEAARNGDAATVIRLLNAPEPAASTTTGDHVVVCIPVVGPTNNDGGIQKIEMASTGHGGSSTPDERAGDTSGSIGGGPLGTIPRTFGRRLLQGVASDGDGLLHISARCEHVNIVSAISGSRWCDAVDVAAKNNRGETALHCAAATGYADMISALLTLLPKDGDKKRRLLREQKDTGETCLHEAVRCGEKLAVERLVQGDVDVALEPNDDGALVGIRDEQGVSPLYLATTLRQLEIVKFLTRRDGPVGYPTASYDGPGGKTAMHAAVLLSKELSICLADWNNELIDKADLSGNTPLHLLASTKETTIMKLLLDADPSAGYRSDNEGSLPIHVAAASGSIEILKLLCERRPGCSWSCNSLGQTILHIAVKNGSRDVVKYVCSGQKFSRIFNTRDTGGNTALHLAVLQGDRLTFCQLMRRREVCLNFTNKEERTPLDLAQMSLPPGISILSGPRDWILHTLLFAEADYGAFGRAGNVGELDKEKESETIGKSAGLVAVCAVLMLTTAFAAPFSVTDLYNKVDASKAKRIAYHIFVMSDVVAFGLSTIAISCATLAGFSFTDRGTRFFILSAGVATLFGAALFMIFVFVAGLYVAIGTIVHGHAFIAVSLLVSTCPIITLYLALAWTFLPYGLMLFSRFGFPRVWRVPGSVTDLHSLEQGRFPRVRALLPRQRQDRSPARHRGLWYLWIRAFPPPKIRIRI